MADTFEFRYAYPTIEFLGGSKRRDVMVVGYVTKPGGYPFEIRIPKALYLDGQGSAAALGMATILETIAGLPGVADVDFGQEQAAGGALRDVVTIYVASTSGDSDASLTVPIVQLGPKLHGPQILALRAQLDKAEAA